MGEFSPDMVNGVGLVCGVLVNGRCVVKKILYEFGNDRLIGVTKEDTICPEIGDCDMYEVGRVGCFVITRVKAEI